MSAAWPDIPYEPWRETCSALHLYTQIVGKYRLARTPWVNHSWHATFYVNACGFTSSLVPDRPGGVEISFDLLDHTVRGAATDGRSAQFSLGPMSVAEFHRRFINMIGTLGGTPKFHWRPNEVHRFIPEAFQDCPTRSRARRTATKCRPPVFGLEVEGSISRRSIPTPIRRRTASPMCAWPRMRRISTSAWASLSCPMMPCGARAIRRQRSCPF